jgi:type IV pilus assembly protein PilB
VRRVCGNCKRPVKLSEELIAELQMTPEDAAGAKVMEGEGCVECNNTGYRGRAGVYEVMTITPELRDLILQRGSAIDLKRCAFRGGMLTLRRDAIEKLKRGVTSVEEVLKETAADKM